MKNVNRLFISVTNSVLTGFLSLLGFSCEGGEQPVEYGVPNAEFQISGKVTDETGKSLAGIRVVVPEVMHITAGTSTFIPDNPIHTNAVHDTTYTSSEGTFTYKYNGFPTDTVCVNMKFEDVSAHHPTYQTLKKSVLFLRSDLKDGKSWFRGKSKKDIKVSLKPKNK